MDQTFAYLTEPPSPMTPRCRIAKAPNGQRQPLEPNAKASGAGFQSAYKRWLDGRVEAYMPPRSTGAPVVDELCTVLR